MWQTGDPVQMDEIALPQFDIRQEDIDYGNCTKYYAGTGRASIYYSLHHVQVSCLSFFFNTFLMTFSGNVDKGDGDIF